MSTPVKISRVLDVLQALDSRQDRIELLIGIADRFSEVPPELAQRPFAREFVIPHCESEAYFWPVDAPDGSLKLYFAVENPQGISARAMAVILDEGLSGEPVEEMAKIEDDLPIQIFGSELSMGKTMGLDSMVAMVRLTAERILRHRSADV